MFYLGKPGLTQWVPLTHRQLIDEGLSIITELCWYYCPIYIMFDPGKPGCTQWPLTCRKLMDEEMHGLTPWKRIDQLRFHWPVKITPDAAEHVYLFGSTLVWLSLCTHWSIPMCPTASSRRSSSSGHPGARRGSLSAAHWPPRSSLTVLAHMTTPSSPLSTTPTSVTPSQHWTQRLVSVNYLSWDDEFNVVMATGGPATTADLMVLLDLKGVLDYDTYDQICLHTVY